MLQISNTSRSHQPNSNNQHNNVSLERDENNSLLMIKLNGVSLISKQAFQSLNSSYKAGQ